MSLPEPANNEAEAFRRHNAALEAERRRVWREETAARLLAAIVSRYGAERVPSMTPSAATIQHIVAITDALRVELDKEIPDA